MLISDRLDEENVVHMQHGILFSPERKYNVLCHNIDRVGDHDSKEINPGTENQRLHVLTHKWVLNNESTRTQTGEQHTPGPRGLGIRGGVAGCWGTGEGQH